MKKCGIVIGVLLSFAFGSGALAAGKSMTCKEDLAFIKSTGESDWATADIKLNIESANEIVLEVKFKSNHKPLLVKASRDQNFENEAEARFVDDTVNIGLSDSGETALFVSKTLLRGRAGRIKIESNQANDGESGEAYLWGTDAILKCQ